MDTSIYFITWVVNELLEGIFTGFLRCPVHPQGRLNIACCDGIVYDAKRNRIILTAAAQNALYAWNIAEGKMELVWANGDTDGADGLFDQPSEVLFLPDDRLVVVNIDAPSPGMINSGADKIHTLSILR